MSTDFYKFNRLTFFIRYILVFIVCMLLVSCTFLKGKGFLDVSLENDYPILIDDNQEGFGTKRMPKKTRWYRVYWGALPVGDLYIMIVPTKEGYGIRSVMRSRGIAKLVSGFKSDAGATMRFVKPDRYEPIRYKTSFNYHKKKRRIDIHWDKNGKVYKETDEPPENRHKRPAVSDMAKEGVYDPLTIIMAVRSSVRSAVRSGKRVFKLPMYDGRRRSNVVFTIHGADKNGNIHVSFREEAVEGYTKNELKDMKKWNTSFNIALSPEDLLPVAGKGKSFIGTAYIKLKKECLTLAECMEDD